MDKIILIHNNVPDRDIFINNINENIHKADKFSNLSNDIDNNAINRIGLVWLNNGVVNIPFFEDYILQSEKYNELPEEFMLKMYPNITDIDLITCNINTQKWSSYIQNIKDTLLNKHNINVNIHYSLDQTGNGENSDNIDWILEQPSNLDLLTEGIYFNSMTNYRYVLDGEATATNVDDYFTDTLNNITLPFKLINATLGSRVIAYDNTQGSLANNCYIDLQAGDTIYGWSYDRDGIGFEIPILGANNGTTREHLFTSSVSSGTNPIVKNFNFVGPTITFTPIADSVGLIDVINVRSNCVIGSGKGGIIGSNFGNNNNTALTSGTINVKYCGYEGSSITSGGGIIGSSALIGCSNVTLNVINCYNKADIISNDTGGIVGKGVLKNTNTCILNMKLCYSIGNVSGGNGCNSLIAGGSSGNSPLYNANNSTILIDECFTFGDISTSGGSLIGTTIGTGSTNCELDIKNCIIFNNITGTNCYCVGAYDDVSFILRFNNNIILNDLPQTGVTNGRILGLIRSDPDNVIDVNNFVEVNNNLITTNTAGWLYFGNGFYNHNTDTGTPKHFYYYSELLGSDISNPNYVAYINYLNTNNNTIRNHNTAGLPNSIQYTINSALSAYNDIDVNDPTMNNFEIDFVDNDSSGQVEGDISNTTYINLLKRDTIDNGSTYQDIVYDTINVDMTPATTQPQTDNELPPIARDSDDDITDDLSNFTINQNNIKITSNTTVGVTDYNAVSEVNSNIGFSSYDQTIFYYTPPIDQTMSFSLVGGANWDTKLHIVKIGTNPLEYIAANDDSNGLQSALDSTFLEGGQEYGIVVGGYATDSQSRVFTLTITLTDGFPPAETTLSEPIQLPFENTTIPININPLDYVTQNQNGDVIFNHEQFIIDSDMDISFIESEPDSVKIEAIKYIFNETITQLQTLINLQPTQKLTIIFSTSELPSTISNKKIRLFDPAITNTITKSTNINSDESYYVPLSVNDATITITDNTNNVIITNNNGLYDIVHSDGTTYSGKELGYSGSYGDIEYTIGSTMGQFTYNNTQPIKWVTIQGTMYGNRRF